MADPRRTLSVTVRMTPKMAVAAERALHRAGMTEENVSLFRASHRIYCGLLDAGWEYDSVNRQYVLKVPE